MNVLFFLVALWIFLSFSISYAFEYEVNLGPDVSYITYREPGFMKERGWFYGIAADAYLKYPLNKCWNLATGLEAKYAWSRVDYSSDESGDMDGIKDRLFEIRLLLGAGVVNNFVSPSHSKI